MAVTAGVSGMPRSIPTEPAAVRRHRRRHGCGVLLPLAPAGTGGKSALAS